MSLSDKTVLELKTILKEEFALECTVEEASEIAESLVGYVDLLQEINTNEYGNTQNIY